MTDLDNPLIPFDQYQNFIDIIINSNIEDQLINELKLLLEELPDINFATLSHLINFMLKFSVYHEENLVLIILR